MSFFFFEDVIAKSLTKQDTYDTTFDGSVDSATDIWNRFKDLICDLARLGIDKSETHLCQTIIHPRAFGFPTAAKVGRAGPL